LPICDAHRSTFVRTHSVPPEAVGMQQAPSAVPHGFTGPHVEPIPCQLPNWAVQVPCVCSVHPALTTQHAPVATQVVAPHVVPRPRNSPAHAVTSTTEHDTLPVGLVTQHAPDGCGHAAHDVPSPR
jgi:hypothetical protein